MHLGKKIGFWSVTSLVIGSQIGSGILLLPASLAKFGAIGLTSWLITSTGALFLALIFSKLCSKIPKTGGPHAYIAAAFGDRAAFYAAWTYWVISWLSTPAVLIAIVGYLNPLLGNADPLTNLFLEILILFSITLLNLSGVGTAGRAEFVFTLLKVIPLLIVPLAGITFINKNNFIPFNPTGESTFTALNSAALLTLWGFIGVESATTPAGSVEKPAKTIPTAIVVGTAVVALVYILSSFVVMGIISPRELEQSKAPFADAATLIFSGHWGMVVSMAASIVCLGTLNAWILTSGQIALGAATDGYFPRFFSVKNKKGAPKWSLIISSLGIVPFLIITMDENLINQVNKIIDISVTAFLFVYTFCVLSYLKIFCHFDKFNFINLRRLCIAIIALIFCGWALWSSGIKVVSLAMLVTLSGIPVYFLMKKNKHDLLPKF